jgi:hypothetical protein
VQAHEGDVPDPFGDDFSTAAPAEAPAAAAAAAAADPADPDGPDGPETALIEPVLEEEGVDATPAIDAAVDTVDPNKVGTSPAIGDSMLVNALLDDKNTAPSDADPTLLNAMSVRWHSAVGHVTPAAPGRRGRDCAARGSTRGAWGKL